VITRRTKFELKARERAHILLGLVVAVSNLDEVVAMIRSAPNPAEARRAAAGQGMADRRDRPIYRAGRSDRAQFADEDGGTYRLSERQVKAILELRLHRLTALGRDEIGGELEELAAAIAEYLSILADRMKLYGVMREELVEIRTLYATPRLSEIAPRGTGSTTRT
jgi:DNA gyrase subunit A